MSVLFAILTFFILGAGADSEISDDSTRSERILDDFEDDRPGDSPGKWRFLGRRDREFRPLDTIMDRDEKFFVVSERGNRFLRAYTDSQAQRISLPAGRLEWKLAEYPILSWEWRALRLPTGAAENSVNDTGGAVYVSFSKTDWLGRPLSIKYTYSSTLPVDTVVSTGNVKIIVVSSGANGMGSWVHIERNVIDDYRRLFGGDPPNEPYTVTLWSDSDDTKTVAEVDFDNLTLHQVGK